jgi:Tol biopolymer transport system component
MGGGKRFSTRNSFDIDPQSDSPGYRSLILFRLIFSPKFLRFLSISTVTNILIPVGLFATGLSQTSCQSKAAKAAKVANLECGAGVDCAHKGTTLMNGNSGNVNPTAPVLVVGGQNTAVKNPARVENTNSNAAGANARSAPTTISVGSLIAKPVTAAGDNSDSSFSPDGSRILFHSRLRPGHKQSQVYELQLGTMLERRITFQDGEVTGARYYPEGHRIIYSSSTDEIKDEAVYLASIMKAYYPEGKITEKQTGAKSNLTLPPSELYAQELDGREIERLTESRGFDGEPAIEAKGNRIVFTSVRNGAANLFLLASKSLVALTDGDLANRAARFSPDGKSLVWTHFNKDLTAAQLMLSQGSLKKPVALTPMTAFQDLHPVFHPGGTEIIFSSNRAGKGFDLYSVDLAGHCLKKITDFANDELYPSFNSDGSKLLFTGNQSGSSQIYLMDYRPPPQCL